MIGNGAFKLSLKRRLPSVFQDAANSQKQLMFDGPDGLKPDSRYAIKEICEDHVVIALFGDTDLVLPYTSIVSMNDQPKRLTIRYK